MIKIMTKKEKHETIRILRGGGGVIILFGGEMGLPAI